MNDVPRGLLRETLRGRMTPERSAGCLDSQTLAAWSDGALSARDRDAIEEHAADCARCQALLAAMVTSAPAIAPTRWPVLRSFSEGGWAWLTPLAAAAAAILLWINVPRSTVDRAATPPAVVTAKAEPPAIIAGPPPAAAAASTPAPSAGRRAAETRREGRVGIGGGTPATLPSRPAPQLDARAADATTQQKGAVDPAKDDVLAGKGTTVETGAAAPRAEPVAPIPVADAGTLSKFDAAGGGRGGGGGGLARFRSTAPEIVSPDASVRWRILPDGQVVRSIDRGAVWQQQSTGASTLTAGAAPSRDVCWLVGPAGIIVLTTDGVTWQRVAFPHAISLVAVRATDGSNATVTAADGRTFTTTDGGKNWRQP
jgi:hypothetical protein